MMRMRRATRLILVVALTLAALSIAGCGRSDSADSMLSAPPPMNAADKQKMDEKRRKDEQIINNLKNQK